MREGVVVLTCLTILVLGCGKDSDRGGKRDARLSDASSGAMRNVNSPCTADVQCKTLFCWNQICTLKNPRGNGGNCFGKGECRTGVCSGGACAPGSQLAGSICRFNEECQSRYCLIGKCAAVKVDAGL